MQHIILQPPAFLVLVCVRAIMPSLHKLLWGICICMSICTSLCKFCLWNY